MERRKAVHEAIEAKRAEQRSRAQAAPTPSGEVFISLDDIRRSRKPQTEAQEPTQTRPVLMAVATQGQGVINQHFGHAREFLVYEATPEDVRFIGHRRVDQYCTGGDTCGDAETALARTIRTLDGCEVVLCSKIGIEPWDRLEAAGLVPNGEHAMEPIEDAVAALYSELLTEGRLDTAEAPAALSA
jgi:nitrogen fixation protein NifB